MIVYSQKSLVSCISSICGCHKSRNLNCMITSFHLFAFRNDSMKDWRCATMLWNDRMLNALCCHPAPVFSLSKIISRSLGLQPQKLQVLSNCCRPRWATPTFQPNLTLQWHIYYKIYIIYIITGVSLEFHVGGISNVAGGTLAGHVPGLEICGILVAN